MFPSMLEEGVSPKPQQLSSSSTQLARASISSPVAEPSFETLILIHRLLKRLHKGEKIDPQLIDKVLSCHALSQAPWLFNTLIDWGMCLVTYQPQALQMSRMRELVNIWKCLWTPTANIINSRNLLMLTKSPNPRDSWIKLGSLSQILINEGILNTSALEQQCFTLLKNDWPDEIQKRISEFLTIVLEAFQEKTEGTSDSAQVLDWVAWLCSGQPDQD